MPITVSFLLSVLIHFFSLPEEKYLVPHGSPAKNQPTPRGNKTSPHSPKEQSFLSPLAPTNHGNAVATQVKTWWLAPSISALKTGVLVGTDNGTSGPTPGDVIEYTVTITNSSTVDDATGVKFTDTIDPNTTLVPGSVKSAPIGVNDAYSTVGNVSIDVPVGSGLLNNDVNLDGDVLSVTAVDVTGTQGNVTFNANGSFTFNPTPGFEGTTTFLYTVNDGTFNATGKVTITVTGMIWFIDDSAPSGGDGRLNTPFNTMNAFNGSSLDGTNDNIFLYSGTYTNTTSTLLLSQQNLIGQGAVGASLAALAGVTFSVHPPMAGATIPSINGTRPIINQAANTINMQSNNEVRGVNINNTSGTALQGNGFTNALVREVSITNTGGTAVDFNNGALDAIIQSVSASNAAVGIKLTATTGSFQVTGTGTTDGSGGTLSTISGYGMELRNVTNITLKNMNLSSINTTSDGGYSGSCDQDNVAACYAAVYMNVANTVTLDNIDIGNTAEHGIMGLSVSNLSINNCTSINNGNAEEENALKFRNLSGTCSITNSAFQNSAYRICHIINTTGTLTLTVNNCTLNNTASSPVGADCFEMRTQGTATATVNLTNNFFQRARTKGVQVFAEGNSTMNFNMTGCSVQRFGGAMAGVEVGSNGTTATMNYNINNNTVIESSGEVSVLASTFSSSDLNGRVNNNTSITNNNATATIFAAVRVLHENDGQAMVEFKNNSSIVSSNIDIPIDFSAVNATTASGRFDVTFESNNVTNSTTTVAGLEGIILTLGDNVGGDMNTLCGHIRSNALTLPSGYPRAFRVRHFNSTVALLQGGGTAPNITTNWSANLNTNTNGTTTSYGPNTGITFGSTCFTPGHPTARIATELLSIDRPQTETVDVAQVVEAPKQEIDNEATAPTPEAIQEAHDETARKSVVLSGETVPVGDPNGFLLPAEKNIIIKFQVTINPTLGAGVCQISNQGTVTGNNFSNVLTDDVAGAPISATVNQLSKHSLGNLVFRDNNKNGLFDGGDVGIDGVLVNLYRDNGSTPGILDAGDTYITNATTAGGGLYNFPNLCSDDYIVQIPSSEFGSGKPLNGLISSPGGTASDPDNNTDNDDNGQDAINSSIASQAITLNYSTSFVENNTSVDFGFRTPTTVSIGNATAAEGSGGGSTTFNFTVTRSDNADAFSLTVNTSTGTANGADFTAISGGSVSFTAGGSNTATVSVTVNADDIVELSETFSVVLSGAPDGVIITGATGTGTINNDDQTTLSINSVSNAEGNSGTTTFTFTVSADKAVDVPYTVTIVTQDASAMSPSDFTGNSSTLTFTGTASETHTFNVAVAGDVTVELNETFTVEINNIVASGRNIASGVPGTGTILNDDAATVSLASNVTQSEATSAQAFTVSLSNPVDVAVSVNFSTTSGGTATAGTDYTTITNQTVTFPANSTTQTVNVGVTNDNIVEPDETYNVILGNLSTSGRSVILGTSAGTGTITNDDAATVTLTGAIAKAEGNSGTVAYTFTATLTNAVQGGFTIAYTTSDGTATVADNDYVDNDGSLTFIGAANETQTITVQVNGDLKIENNETFTVALGAISSAPAGVTVAGTSQTGTINNDELDWGDAPTSGLSGFASSYPTTLADNGARHTLTPGGVFLGTTVTADLDGQPTATANGDATGDDGVTLPGAFVVNTTTNLTVVASAASKLDAWIDFNRDGDWNDAGEKVADGANLAVGSNTISVNVPAGASVGTSYARFRVSNAGGLSPTGAATEGEVEDYQVSILDNQFSINDVSIAEGNSGTTNLIYTISRTTNSAASSVDYAITGGTATSGSDYQTFASGTINFTAGGPLTQTITVVVNGDNVVEGNETVIVTLSNPINGGIGTATGTGTINNDDFATLTLSTVAAQNEGALGTVAYAYELTLDKEVTGGFTVNYNTNDGTATKADGDYQDNDGSLTFTGTPGEKHTITVLVNGDLKVELDEEFTVVIGSISGTLSSSVSLSGSPTRTATITNDDQAIVSLAGNVSQSEATTPQVFTVNLSNPVDVNVTLNFATTDVTTSGDYTPVNQTVTFTAGSTTAQTVNVAVTNDNIVEPNETFNVTLSGLSASSRNVIFGTTTGTGTITNDDAATVTLTGATAKAEGNSGTVDYTFTATLNNPVQGGLTVAYATNDGTATVADNDYIDNDGSLTFAGVASETKTIIVKVNGDLKIENNEDFVVALGAISSAPAGVTVGGTSQTGTINNDELDWGDAPTAGLSSFASSYPTTLADNGARHTLTPGGVFLGTTVTGDLDGQPTATANGDATGDDGVTLPSAFILNTTANVSVVASAVSKLDAWIDFNRDGDWNDAGEKVADGANLVAGANTISVNVPAGASIGTSFARFRVSNAGGLSPTGAATEGEVEDYQVMILNNLFSINDVSITEGNSGTTNLTYTISRTTNSTASSVDYAITGGTATSGNDYQAFASGTINFTAGGPLTQTITVVINGDNVVEDNETVIVTLSNPTNGAISTATGTGTINNDDAATLTLTGGVAKNEGNSGNTAYTFTATLSAPVQGGFTVAYTTNNGTATAGTDYTDNDGNLTFAGTANETQTWTVNVSGDNLVEANETFSAALGAITSTTAIQLAAITPGGTPQTATITNDDAATVSLAGNVSQSEATTPQVFTVNLSNPVDINVTVNFSTSDGTATTTDNDYTAVTNQTVTFTAGSTTAQTVSVSITNDSKVEANEIFNVALSSLSAPSRNVTIGTAAGTGTITNDDASTVTLTGGTSKTETNTGTVAYTFTATLTNAVQGGFTVAYTTSDGTATVADNDYVDNDGSLTFTGTANETKTITVQVNGDLKIENNEDFVVALGTISGAPSGVTVGGTSQTNTIENDELDWGDAPDTYKTLSASNGPRHANAPGGIRLGATIDADLDGQPNATASGDGSDDDGVTLPSVLVLNTSASVTVNASAAGKLDAWVDFDNNGTFDVTEKVFNNVAVTSGSNSLTFNVPAGATPSNSFARFRLSTAGGLSPEGVANDGEVEDYAIQIVNTQFSINDVTITEGNSGTTNLTFTISRTVNANACSIDYAITGGTATTGNDYQTFASGTATFTAGGALSQTITVVINGDQTVELDETILMTLSNPINAAILDGSGTGTITNDDAGVITVSNPSVFEGSTGTTMMTFNVNLSNPSDAAVVVNYTTVDGTATTADNDYVSTSGTLTFAAGETAKTVTVTVNGDCKDEPNETLLLRLSSLNANSRNVSLSGGGASLDGTGTINNTPLPTATIAGNATVCLNGTAPQVTFTGANGTSPYTFNYQINGSTQTPLVSTGNTTTTSVATSTAGIYTYTLLSVSDANGCSSNVGNSVAVVVQGKPDIKLSAQQQEFNEGNTQTLCDIDSNPSNGLQFTVTTNCVVGTPQWRVQIGSGTWGSWTASAPTTQPSDNQLYRYQAACDINCSTTYTGIISLRINYRASVPQQVSMVADGVTVNAGESKTVCDLAGTTLVFNATCAAGEMVLYSVDGANYASIVPTQQADGQVHTYRVRCRKADGTPSCIESESAPMSLKTVSSLAAPVVSLNPTSNCGTPVPMTSTTTCTGMTTLWYNATTNELLSSLPSTTPSETTSYYARCQADAGCLSEKSNVVTFTVLPVNVAPMVSASQTVVCTGTTVTVSANCPAGSKAFWNTGVNENSFQVAFDNVTTQTYWAKCIFTDGCQSTESVRLSVRWKAFELTFINIGQSRSAVKSANDRNLWTNQFITPDGGPSLDNSTQQNPTLYFVENVNKTAPRFWTIQVDACALGTNGSLTFDMLATPEVGVVRSYNTHENNAPYFMYANRDGFTELYAQNHPAYGFYEDNGVGGNVYDVGLPKGLYKLSVRYWDMKGWGSIYPSTRQPQGNVLAYQEYWFRIQSKDGVGVGAAKVSADLDPNGMTKGAFAQVMPNPVSKTLRLKVAGSKGEQVKATLSDAAGRKVELRTFVPETNAHQEEFEVSQLPSGMYFLQVVSPDKQATLKVVKID